MDKGGMVWQVPVHDPPWSTGLATPVALRYGGATAGVATSSKRDEVLCG